MQKQYRLVREFHKTFDHPVSETPKPIGKGRGLARCGWLREEVEEFEAACITDDLVDQVDAVMDIMYLSIGALVEMGVAPEEVFNEVHKANMGKRFPDGKVHKMTSGKTAKPEGWKPPEEGIAKILQNMSDKLNNLNTTYLERFVCTECGWSGDDGLFHADEVGGLYEACPNGCLTEDDKPYPLSFRK